MTFTGLCYELRGTKATDLKDALAFLRKAIKRHGRPKVIVTDRSRSHGPDLKYLGRSAEREMAFDR